MSTLKTDAIEAATGTNTDLSLDGKGTGVPDLGAGFKVGSVAGVPTASIRDDAVTLAKLAAGTDGELITWDASGDPATVAVGTATHVLTSNGAGAAPTFQAAAAGGAWTVIESKVPTAAASVDFTTNIDSTYSLYMFNLVDVAGSSGSKLAMRTSTDAGSSWDTTSGDYRWGLDGIDSDQTTLPSSGSSTATMINLSRSDTGSSQRASCQVFLCDPSAARDTLIMFDTVNHKSATVVERVSGSAFRDSAADVNGVQFIRENGGNFGAVGRITLYGIAIS